MLFFIFIIRVCVDNSKANKKNAVDIFFENRGGGNTNKINSVGTYLMKNRKRKKKNKIKIKVINK